MVREMMLLGVLEQEKAKGLQVSAKEERKAKLGLLKQEEGEWMMREMPEDAIFWKVKDIEWQVVESWVGVQGHELPLRKSAGERVEVSYRKMERGFIMAEGVLAGYSGTCRGCYACDRSG